MANPLRRRRKVAPRHALARPRRSEARDNTTIMLIVVLIVTSGFVVGTTATFTSSTRNGGNSFTVAGIATPTAPTVSLAGTKATFGWTQVSGAAYNVGVGYRILRKAVGGPLDTAGSPQDCTNSTYSTLDYSAFGTVSYDDATIPSTTADQGMYYCYATEGVWPCCPTNGKTPVITTRQGRAAAAIQTGYVASSWAFGTGATGNGNQVLASGEVVTLNFNQDVNVSTSITTSETLCVDPWSKRVLLGVTATTFDSCQYEVQTVTITGSPTSGNFKVAFNGSANSANIAYNASASAFQTAFRALSTVGATSAFVTGPVITGAGTTKTTVWKIYFANTRSGNLVPVTTAAGAPNLSTGTLSVQTLFDGITESGSLGYLANAGTYSNLPARYDISSVVWSNCSSAGVSCKTVTITAGAVRGSNSAVSLPLGTWTYVPAAATGKSKSATGALTLCVTNPANPALPLTGIGLCQPTATAGW